MLFRSLAPDGDILVMTDSRAALMAIEKSASSGKGRTRDLVEVVDKVDRRSLLGLSTQFGWVKAHIGIRGNERADQMGKACCRELFLPQITEGRVRARWKAIRTKERAKSGLGDGRVVCWNRRAVLRYPQLRVGKGHVGGWRQVLGAWETLCRLCGVEEETWSHMVFGCEEGYELRPWN